MSAVNCEDCIFRKRISDFNRHVFTDFCYHPMAASCAAVGTFPAALCVEVRAITPDHSEPTIHMTHPRWCPRTQKKEK